MASIFSDNLTVNNDSNKLLEFEILDSLKEFIGSEPFGQYLSEYIANTLRNIDKLGIAIASEDENRVKQVSHKLKGSAGNIGAFKLSNVCTTLQSVVLDDQTRDSVCEQYRELQFVYQETREALTTYIDHLEESRLNVG